MKPPMAEEEPMVAGDASAPSQLTPAESMAIAHQLATHPWRPFAGNILHGKDKSGILVNTPDAGLISRSRIMGPSFRGDFSMISL